MEYEIDSKLENEIDSKIDNKIDSKTISKLKEVEWVCANICNSL